MNGIDTKLKNAFCKQDYRECKRLIEYGANKEVILRLAKKIGGKRLTMSQDRIIRDLT